MRKRTSKQRVVWLPFSQDDDQAPDAFTGGSGIKGDALTVSGAQQVDVFESPLTIDVPRDPATESLSDLESSGYRLRRIVGRIWIDGERTDEESGLDHLWIGVGAIVRRVEQGGNSLAEVADIAAGTFDNTSLFATQNSGDPWIFQHLIRLQNPGFIVDTTSNADRPSTPLVVDVVLPIDQKTARIIGPEERVFLHCSAVGIGASPENQLTNSTLIFWDLRVLASMRTSTGNRRNASR